VQNVGSKCTLSHSQGVSSTTAAPSTTTKKRRKNHAFFCAFGDCGYNDYDEYYIDHDYHDHGYIMIGYFDIDIKGNIYSNSSATTPINSVRVVTCVDNTPIVTAGGKKKEAPEGDAVTVLGARPIH
jgi:hypothetical protein